MSASVEDRLHRRWPRSWGSAARRSRSGWPELAEKVVQAFKTRSSQPAHSPTALARGKLERITTLRLQRLTADQIARRLKLPRSTVARHLGALGLGTLPPLHPPPPVVRYERERPGELIHIDTKKLGRFRRLGHRITGNRNQSSEGAGWDYLHVCIDDATRLAYVEIHPDEGRYHRPHASLGHLPPISRLALRSVNNVLGNHI